jgi:hypothetical protein
MHAFHVRGWELVLSHVSDPLARSLASGARRVARLGEGRYAIDLPLEALPDRVLAEAAAAGATLVSLNPIRDTLEDFFVRQVTTSDALGHDRGLGDEAAARSRR